MTEFTDDNHCENCGHNWQMTYRLESVERDDDRDEKDLDPEG